MNPAEVYRSLRQRLVSLAQRRGAPDPQDCADEAMTRFLRRYCADSMQDMASVVLAAEENLAALFTTLRNVVFEQLRRRQREHPDGEDLMSRAADTSIAADDAMAEAEHRACVQSCILKLNFRQRYALLLREKGLRYEEIAAQMTVPVTDVTNWLHRAKTQIRRCLHENCRGAIHEEKIQ